MAPADTMKSLEYFRAKLDPATGPLELYEMIRENEDINVQYKRSY